MYSGAIGIIIFAVVLLVMVIATVIAIVVLKSKYPSGYKAISLIILIIEFVILGILYYLISSDIIKF